MLGSDDFRPEARHRASGPSLEEMLRRARDAHLGNNPETTGASTPRFTPFATRGARTAPGRVRDCTLLLIGVLFGMLIACTTVRVGTLVSGSPTQVQPTTQTVSSISTPVPATTTDIPSLMPTDTPVPTPTDVPTAAPDPYSAPPPTTDEIASLAQDFYDTLSPFAGTYVMANITGVQVQNQDDTQLTVCILYDFADVSSSGTVAGTDTRIFVLAYESDGTWQVVEMGSAASCSLS